MYKNKVKSESLKTKVKKMKKNEKVLLFLILILILVFSLLLIKNFFFEEAALLTSDQEIKIEEQREGGENRQALSEDSAAVGEQKITAEKIYSLEEINNPFFKKNESGNSSSKVKSDFLIYSENELVTGIGEAQAEKEAADSDKSAVDSSGGIDKSSTVDNDSKLNTGTDINKSSEIDNSTLINKSAERNNNESKTSSNLKQVSETKKSQLKIRQVEIPFSLIGIIKSDNSSTALFSYKNSVIEKCEGQEIEGFIINEIKRDSVLFSYSSFSYRQFIWRHDKIEKSS